MRASTKRTLSMLISIALLVGAVFVYSSMIKPAYSEIKSLRSEVVSRLEIINENQAYISQVQNLLNEYQNISQLQSAISILLPDEQNLAQALNQISGLIGISGLSPQKASANQLAIRSSLGSSVVKKIGTLRFEVETSGNYPNFKDFLQKLETNMGVFDVVSIKIEPPGRSAGVGIFNYTTVIDSYYQTQ